MADERKLTYDIDFETGEAQGNINALIGGLESVDTMASQIKSAATAAGSALGDMGGIGRTAAQEISDTAAGIGAGFNTAASEARGAFSDIEDAAATAAGEVGSGFDEASDEARAAFRQMGADASSFGDAFKRTMAAGIKEGQSLGKSIQTGLGGALAFTQKKVTTFTSGFTKGVKSIGTALMHPIQTIKSKLTSALDDARKDTDEVGESAKKSTDDLDKMGAAGDGAGSKIGSAIKGAVAAFLSFEAIKAATSAVKDFIGNALEAAKLGENTGAKFNRLFAGSDGEDWANNFSTAVNRSTNEVKGFLVQNRAMFTELGTTGDAANELSKVTTSLAYDFGAAFKMADADALAVLQEGIKSGGSALEEYGIKLDDATLKEQALKMGIKDKLEKLDESTMAQLRMSAILDQSSDIQRAAMEQTDGLANSTKSLSGVWENFMSKAGAKFTPVFEKFFGTIIKSWPKIEPALMTLVDLLANGLSQALPILTDLGMSLLPTLAEVLGLVFTMATPLMEVFGEIAQTVLPPLSSIFSNLASSILPPLADIFVTLVNSAIMPLMPLVETLVSALLPPFVELLGMIAPAIEMFSPILSMAAQLLAPIAQIIGQFISALLPPIMSILGTIFGLIEPFIPILLQVAQAILPPISSLLQAIAPILGVISPILQALSPVLEVIGSVLQVIGDVLGTVIGWLADGVGAVVNFFTGLFGGATESEKAVTSLDGAVSGLEDTASKDISLTADTSSYASDITTASTEANKTAQENIIATKDISDVNLKLMGAEATSTYATMAIDSETAWDRMVKAAEDGAKRIVDAFKNIATAAGGVSGANISVTGADIPGHASGTDNFAGGWTTINERGGELAFLPSGSAIIPADKSERIMDIATAAGGVSGVGNDLPDFQIDDPPDDPTPNDPGGARLPVPRSDLLIMGADNKRESAPVYAPSLSIVVEGNADDGVIDRALEKGKAMFKELFDEFYQEARQDEYSMMTIKNAIT